MTNLVKTFLFGSGSGGGGGIIGGATIGAGILGILRGCCSAMIASRQSDVNVFVRSTYLTKSFDAKSRKKQLGLGKATPHLQEDSSRKEEAFHAARRSNRRHQDRLAGANANVEPGQIEGRWTGVT